MNISQAPKSSQRKTDVYDTRLKIKTYDKDNLYPQNVMSIVYASSTASTCLERFQDYIEGNGLSSQKISDMIVNHRQQTMDEIHHLCSLDFGLFNGFSIHVNYDIYCRPCEIQHVPFEDCRIEEPDDNDYVAHIIVHPDWTGNKTRNGKKVFVNANNVDVIDVFNPDPSVVADQIIKAGGIDHYKGQILYYSKAGYMTYPRPRYDSCITDISTDEGLSNVTNRNVRNNFLPAGIVVYYKNKTPLGYDEKGNPITPDSSATDDFVEQIKAVQGDTKACKLIAFGIDYPQEKPMFEKFNVNNYDKDFSVSQETVEDRIYSIFGQEGWLCLRKGKIGFSGDLINDIKKEYCESVTKYQRPLTNAYFKILSRFDPDSVPDAVTVENLKIEPYIKSVTPNPIEP